MSKAPCAAIADKANTTVFAIMLSWVVLSVPACRPRDDVSGSRAQLQRADSAAVVDSAIAYYTNAMAALSGEGDTARIFLAGPMQVFSFETDSSGFVLVLIPEGPQDGGGATVRTDSAGRVTSMEIHQ